MRTCRDGGSQLVAPTPDIEGWGDTIWPSPICMTWRDWGVTICPSPFAWHWGRGVQFQLSGRDPEFSIRYYLVPDLGSFSVLGLFDVICIIRGSRQRIGTNGPLSTALCGRRALRFGLQNLTKCLLQHGKSSQFESSVCFMKSPFCAETKDRAVVWQANSTVAGPEIAHSWRSCWGSGHGA